MNLTLCIRAVPVSIFLVFICLFFPSFIIKNCAALWANDADQIAFGLGIQEPDAPPHDSAISGAPLITSEKCLNASKLLGEGVRKAFQEGDYLNARRILTTKIKYRTLKRECPEMYLNSLFYITAMDLYSGRIYDAREGIEKGLLVIEHLKKNNQTYLLEDIFLTLKGEYFLEARDYVLARKYYEEANTLLQTSLDAASPDDVMKVKNLKSRIGTNLANIGFAMASLPDTLKEQQFRESINAIDLALDIFDPEKQDSSSISYRALRYTQLYKAAVFIKYHDFSGKETDLDTALALIEDTDTMQVINPGSRLNVIIKQYKALAYLKRGDLEKANEEIEELVTYYDSNVKKVYLTQVERLLEIAILALPEDETNNNVKKFLRIFNKYNRYKSEAQVGLGVDKRLLEEEIQQASEEVFTLESKIEKSNKNLRILEDTKNKILPILGLFFCLAAALTYFLIQKNKVYFQLKEQKAEIERQKKALERNNKILKDQKLEIELQKEFTEQKRNFLSLLHQHAGTLGRLVEKKMDRDAFMAETVNETLGIAQQQNHIEKIDIFYIGILEPDGKRLKIYPRETGSKSQRKPDNPVFVELSDNNSLSSKVFKTQQPQVFNDFQKEYSRLFTKLPETMIGEEPASVVIAPLPNRLGVISVQAYEKQAYQEKEDYVQILETLGENISVALGSVHAIGQLTSMNQQLETTNQILQREKEHVSLLQREISHRVKNHLQTLALTIEQQLESEEVANVPKTVYALNETKSRVNAILLVHNHLDQKGDLEKKFLSAQKYFTDLVTYLFDKSFGYAKHQTEIDIRLQNVKPLYFELVQDLGLAITELGLNVFEHAYKYKKKEEHWIRFEAHVNDNFELQLAIEDRGEGLEVEAFEKSKRFGFRLVKTTIRARYKGKISIEQPDNGQGGTKFLITIPISKAMLI